MAELVLNLYEAKTALSSLVERAASGEEIIIAKNGRPRAKLVRLSKRPEPRKPGGWEGQMMISDDFEDPLPENILAAFEGKADGTGKDNE